MDGAALALCAERLVGTRFRLHGRCPETGLDCVGVVTTALRAAGLQCDLPTGYRLRTGEWPDANRWAERNGFAPAEGELQPGDVLLLRPGPGQLHLALVGRDPRTTVEAHAGLRKVVLGRAPPPDAILACWRLPILS